MINLSSKKYNLLFFVIQFTLLKLTVSQDSFNSNANCKVILINQKIVYIIDNTENNQIYVYNTNIQIGNYGLSDVKIINKKNIIKISEHEFIIFGLNQNNYFCYQFFSFSDSAIL